MKKLLVLGLLLGAFVGSEAQVAPMSALNSGNISALDNVRKVNIIYDYSELGVGAFKKEEDYVNKKYSEYEAKEKGKGDKFKDAWYAARKKTYEPAFQTLFNKVGPKQMNMTGTNYSTNEKYTLVVKTTFIEPGLNIGIARKPAYIDAECIFKDANDNVLCVFFIKNAIGAQVGGFDYDVSSRLKESYAKCAKMLAGIIAKERKKKGKK